MFSHKCYLIIFVNTHTFRIEEAQHASEYPVTMLGGRKQKQMCVLKTRGANYDEASRRMQALLKTSEYSWLNPIMKGAI